MRRNGRIEPFNRLAVEYDEWFDEREVVYKSELLAVKEMLPPGGTGIEIGVGGGRFAAPLGIQFGVDPAPGMLKYAVRRGVPVTRGVAEQLPFRDNTFDFALMATVICFLGSVTDSFAEARRVLKPGATLVVAFLDRLSHEGRKLEKNRSGSEFFWAADFYSPDEVEKLMRKTGFENIEFVETVVGNPAKIKSLQKPVKGWGSGLFVVARGNKQIEV